MEQWLVLFGIMAGVGAGTFLSLLLQLRWKIGFIDKARDVTAMSILFAVMSGLPAVFSVHGDDVGLAWQPLIAFAMASIIVPLIVIFISVCAAICGRLTAAAERFGNRQ